MQKVLRCYAEGRGGQWEAICLDFDIAVQGTSFPEVYQSLHQAVQEYLEYVQGLPKEEQSRFLNRSMPLPSRLKLAAKSLLALLITSGSESDNKERHSYTVPCRA